LAFPKRLEQFLGLGRVAAVSFQFGNTALTLSYTGCPFGHVPLVFSKMSQGGLPIHDRNGNSKSATAHFKFGHLKP
jgi:hypothetical protein